MDYSLNLPVVLLLPWAWLFLYLYLDLAPSRKEAANRMHSGQIIAVAVVVIVAMVLFVISLSLLRWRSSIVFPAIWGLLFVLIPIRFRYRLQQSHGEVLKSWWVVTDALQILVAFVSAVAFVRVAGLRNISGHLAFICILYLLFAINAFWLLLLTRQRLKRAGTSWRCNLLMLICAAVGACSIAAFFSLPDSPIKSPDGATLGWHGVWEEMGYAWTR